MKTYSELLDLQARGKSLRLNHGNKVTVKRKNLGRKIIREANGQPQHAYNISMGILGDNVNRLQEYVISHSEEPAPQLPNLVKQVMFLRKKEAGEAQEILDFDGEESRIFLEQQEADFMDENGYAMDNFLGDLGAPLDIAYSAIEGGNNADSFAATGLIGGLVNMVGTKLNDAELKRAAQGKSANFLTGISTGGKAHYNALVAYFKAHPDIKQKVLSGEITQEDALPGWTAPNSGNYDPVGRDAVRQFASPYVDDQVKRYMPLIIGGAILLIIIVIVIVSRHKK